MPNGLLFLFPIFFFFLPMSRSELWWHAFRAVFLYHCMRPPILKSFPSIGWWFVLPYTMWSDAWHATPPSLGFGGGNGLLWVWSGKHIVHRKYLQETEKTSGKIKGRETRSSCDIVLSSGDRGHRTAAVPSCSDCGLSKVLCSGRKRIVLFQERGGFPGIPHSCKSWSGSQKYTVCTFFSKLRMTM